MVFHILARAVDDSKVSAFVVVEAGGALDGAVTAVGLGPVTLLGELGGLTLAVVPVIQSMLPLD
ncbi:MAG: hypothetical protein DBP01_11515 [gamma proteobacterium symbiont of Ctena orbiculata]|nr:MAG: hypothetical protein DBP01_11515 [gamma proteobacterium symbiont of Ctena orbiculata]